jgi:serine-type D-Ala-D-Ala carboxypeptidase (penicillin-binding protein 5/6)
MTGVKMIAKLPRLILALALLSLAAAPVAEAQTKKPAAARPAPKAAPAAKAQAAPPAPEVDANGMPVIQTAAKYAYMVDADTGQVLLNKNGNERMYPSSMTKMLTAYMIFSKLKKGDIKLDDELVVSEAAWRQGGSKMFVPLGARVKIEDLLRGVIIQSGNDACIVLAEGLAGSQDAFAEDMNRWAKQLGMNDSNFRNPDGWPDPQHYSTAHDLATIAIRTIKDFPEYYKYYGEREFAFNGIKQGNRNPLLYQNVGADGLKTGHTEEAGYGLTASAERSGRRVIVVINGLTSMRQRGEEGERLLEWAFREFEDVTLFTAGETVDQAKVWLGVAPTVPLVGGRDLVVTMPRGWRNKVKVAIQYDSPVRAPVARGTELGKLSVSGPGVPDTSMPLLAGADVPLLGLPGRAVATLSHYLTGT